MISFIAAATRDAMLVW